MNIGTWNVRTLLQAGRLHELIQQIKMTSLEIVAIQETRWSGNGLIKKDNFVFYYNGPNAKTGQAGMGFLLKDSMMRHVINFKPVNERLCKMRIKGKYNNITIINVHAPTNEQEDEEKEQFYESLQRTVDQTPKSDIVVILGDFNAKLGKEELYKKVTGNFTLHDQTNENGEILCNFAAYNDFKIVSTQFQHKAIHKGTWISPDQRTINQIDHVLINSGKSEMIEDVRSLRGPNVDTDHYLLKVLLNQKLPNIYMKKPVKAAKWNKSNIQDQGKLKEYRMKLVEFLKNCCEQDWQDVNEHWKVVKEGIIKAADEVIGKQGKRPKNEWWDKDCESAVQKKNDARNKAMQNKTRASYENYQLKRKEANRICRMKKKKWINQKLEVIEQSHRKNESRKFFGDIKCSIQQSCYTPFLCKDKEGNVLAQKVHILQRWKEYFQETLNSNNQGGENLSITGEVVDEDEYTIPTFNEVCHIINKLKINKAAGTDNIQPELIKYGGRVLKKEMHKLMLKIWSSESMPEEWKRGIICPIYKKGDRQDCNNYRPITLLNIAYKILASLLNQRLCDIVETQIGEQQSGFRRNRSTIDNIFIVRQIFERCLEYNIELHNIFIDYTQAFDSVYRNKIKEALMMYKVPNKLIRLIMLTLHNTKASVKINNELSSEFEITTGVKQGDPLSATLFSLIVDTIMKQQDFRGSITTRLKQYVAYADDILITTRTKNARDEAFQQLKEVSMQYGLIINNQKTKFMRCKAGIINLSEWKMDNDNFQEVKSCKYLGTTINGNNSIEEEIKERIMAGNRAFFASKIFFQSKLISRSAKLRLYAAVIRPVVTYAAETWILRNADVQRLMIFERKILRKIFGPVKQPNGTWRIKYNVELDKIIKHKNIVNHIRALRLSWFGHVYRMDDERLPKKILGWMPIATRVKGRPRTRWKENVLKDLKSMNIKNWASKIQNRKEWKAVVEQAKAIN